MIYLMRTKERMEKSAARHKIQSNMAKRVLLYGIRKEYSLKELPAIGKGIYGKPYFPEYPEICFNYSHADAGILCGIAETPAWRGHRTSDPSDGTTDPCGMP